MFNGNGGSTVTGCLFLRNRSEDRGGAMYNNSASTILGCTFYQNSSAVSGGAIYNYSNDGIVANSILWDDSPDEIARSGAPVTFSNIEHVYEGPGNIEVYPMFVDLDSGDFRLGAGSPCIDAGDNTMVITDVFDLDDDGDTEEPLPLDLADLPRFVDDPDTEDTGRCGDPCALPIVDMGAYEFQVAGGCIRDPEWICDGDVDGDGQVNPVDAGLVQAAFGSAHEQDVCNYDMDCDGQINPVDSGIVQSLFGTCEAPREGCP